jgi:hypothetical protein
MEGGKLMVPDLFCADWERLFEILIVIVIEAFLLERALALRFDPRLLKKGGRRAERALNS